VGFYCTPIARVRDKALELAGRPPVRLAEGVVGRDDGWGLAVIGWLGARRSPTPASGPWAGPARRRRGGHWPGSAMPLPTGGSCRAGQSPGRGEHPRHARRDHAGQL